MLKYGYCTSTNWHSSLQLTQPSSDNEAVYYREWVKDLFNYKRYSSALNCCAWNLYSFRDETRSVLSQKYQPSKSYKSWIFINKNYEYALINRYVHVFSKIHQCHFYNAGIDLSGNETHWIVELAHIQMYILVIHACLNIWKCMTEYYISTCNSSNCSLALLNTFYCAD